MDRRTNQWTDKPSYRDTQASPETRRRNRQLPVLDAFDAPGAPGRVTPISGFSGSGFLKATFDIFLHFYSEKYVIKGKKLLVFMICVFSLSYNIYMHPRIPTYFSAFLLFLWFLSLKGFLLKTVFFEDSFCIFFCIFLTFLKLQLYISLFCTPLLITQWKFYFLNGTN